MVSTEGKYTIKENLIKKFNDWYQLERINFHRDNNLSELSFSPMVTRGIIIIAFIIILSFICSLRLCFSSSSVRRVFHMLIAPVYILLLSLSKEYVPSERVFYAFFPFVCGIIFYVPTIFPQTSKNHLSNLFRFLFSHNIDHEIIKTNEKIEDKNKEHGQEIEIKKNKISDDSLGLFLYGFVTGVYCLFFYHVQNIGTILNFVATPIGKLLYKRLLPFDFVEKYIVPMFHNQLSKEDDKLAHKVHGFLEDCYRSIICSISSGFLIGLLCLCGGDGMASIFSKYFKKYKISHGYLPYNKEKTFIGSMMCFIGSMTFLIFFFLIVPRIVMNYMPFLIYDQRLPFYIDYDKDGNIYEYFGGMIYNSLTKINQSLVEAIKGDEEISREKYLRIPIITKKDLHAVLKYFGQISFISSLAESLPFPGSYDNAIIFFIVAIGSFIPKYTIYGLLIYIVAAILYKRKNFTYGGAIAGFFAVSLNFLLSNIAGWTLISFVVTSVIASKYKKNLKSQKLSNDKEVKMGRTAKQVLAVAMPSMMCSIISILFRLYNTYINKDTHWTVFNYIELTTPNAEKLETEYIRFKAFEFAAIVSHAAALSDTIASELGTVLSVKLPRDILHLTKLVPVGTNGGVTLIGTIYGFLGALGIGLIFSIYQCWLFVEKQSSYIMLHKEELKTGGLLVSDSYFGIVMIVIYETFMELLSTILKMSFIIGIYALISCTIDSMMGSAFQFSGLDKSHRITNDVKESVEVVKKHNYLTNTQINFISEAVVTISAYTFAFYFYF